MGKLRSTPNADVGVSLGLAAFRLAAFAYESIEAQDDELAAARFVAEAIGTLLPVTAVELRLAEQISREAVFFRPRPCHDGCFDELGEEIAFQEEDRRSVTCRVIWSGPQRRGADPSYDLAFAGFLLHTLGRRVGSLVERSRRLEGLTDAERAVAELLELPVAEIVSRLGVAKSTVDSHLKRIYRKLGVHSRREAAKLLLEARHRSLGSTRG